MNVLLDTHFLLWTVLGAKRLQEYPWLNAYRPWGVSPVSFLEIQFLAEVGRLAHIPHISRAISSNLSPNLTMTYVSGP